MKTKYCTNSIELWLDLNAAESKLKATYSQITPFSNYVISIQLFYVSHTDTETRDRYSGAGNGKWCQKKQKIQHDTTNCHSVRQTLELFLLKQQLGDISERNGWGFPKVPQIYNLAELNRQDWSTDLLSRGDDPSLSLHGSQDVGWTIHIWLRLLRFIV